MHTSDKEHGDLLIHGFWAHGTNDIINVQVTDTSHKSYHLRDPHKVLAQQQEYKKKKYLNACWLKQRKNFTPFVISTDGLIGHEAV